MSVRGSSWRSTLGRVSRRRFDGSARDRHRSLGMRTATGRVAAGPFVRTCTCVCPVRPQRVRANGVPAGRSRCFTWNRRLLFTELHDALASSVLSGFATVDCTTSRDSTDWSLGPSHRDCRFPVGARPSLGSRAGCSGRVGVLGTQRSAALLFHVKPGPEFAPVCSQWAVAPSTPRLPCSTRVGVERCMPVARSTVDQARSTHPHSGT